MATITPILKSLLLVVIAVALSVNSYVQVATYRASVVPVTPAPSPAPPKPPTPAPAPAPTPPAPAPIVPTPTPVPMPTPTPVPPDCKAALALAFMRAWTAHGDSSGNLTEGGMTQVYADLFDGAPARPLPIVAPPVPTPPLAPETCQSAASRGFFEGWRAHSDSVGNTTVGGMTKVYGYVAAALESTSAPVGSRVNESEYRRRIEFAMDSLWTKYADRLGNVSVDNMMRLCQDAARVARLSR